MTTSSKAIEQAGSQYVAARDSDILGKGEKATIHEHISIKLDEPVGSASISPSGRDVCLAARKGLFIVDLDDPWAAPRFLPHYSDIVADVQWSPHPSRAHWVVSTSGPKALVWNLAATQTSASPIEHVCLGHERSITDINWAVFQFDSLATCGIDGQVLSYDLRLGGRRPTTRYCGWRYGATQVKYNRQNPNQLASSHGEFVYIWDDRKGSSPITTIRAHEQKIYGIDWSRKTRDDIVTCSLDSTVKYWHLDGSPSVEAPTHVIETSAPVWRARHTPFGNGIVTLPQRSEYSVKLWSPSSPSAPMEVLSSSHTDVVREFLWRTKGGNDAANDDREFQLVTWGNDRQLRLTPVSSATAALVGHVPHAPIEVRQTRRNAENRSFRDPTLPSPSALAVASTSPGDQAGGTSSSSFGLHTSSSSGEHKMTPPSALSTRIMPMSAASASRYGRSANSAGATTGSHSSTGGSPYFGTSPADYKTSYLHDGPGNARRSVHVVQSSSNLAALGAGLGARPGADSSRQSIGGAKAGPSFMTRGGAGRRAAAGGHDTVSWMENVRIVSGQTGQEKPGDLLEKEENLAHDTVSTVGDRDNIPLHEELTATARAFESRVRFEKIAIPTRTVVVALYGPWAASGLSVFLRATFTFPPQYPSVSLSIDIERSSSISNKGRAKLLTVVRDLAARHAARSRNALEACLVCLHSGKLQEPDDHEMEDAAHEGLGDRSAASQLLLGNLAGEEDEEAEDEEDLDRLLANRNCPPPRRCGAVFSPLGHLFAFFPLDPLHHFPSYHEKRHRSRSPSLDRKAARPRRRRLFESFGVIPSLQVRAAHESGFEEGVEEDQDEDSDEILNIPSLLMARRRQSRGRTESVGTSQHQSLRVGTGRAFNSRVYSQNVKSLIGVDLGLSSDYCFRGDIAQQIAFNSSLVKKDDSVSWLVARTWSTLLALSQTSAKSSAGQPQMPTFLNEKLPERLVLDMLDLFLGLGDTQMLGILACLIELDRRTFSLSKPLLPKRFSRSPGQPPQVDYFSLKPTRSSRSSDNAQRHSQERAMTPSGQNAPFKSPKDWLMSSSYGTQASSGGSSTRGSSWANNLSTFFRSAGVAGERAGRTPPSDGSPRPSPGAVSPAFVKRAAIAPLREIRRVGGIASGRPGPASVSNVNQKPKPTTHVSFAASAIAEEAPPASPSLAVTSPIKAAPLKMAVKFVVRQVTSPESIQYRSLLLDARMQAQLEYYRLLYADLLLRLDLPLQRAQVLKLTRSSFDKNNQAVIRPASGLSEQQDKSVSLELACPVCGCLLNGRSPAYCGTCKKRRKPTPCSVCHLPLSGLTETCLACLHSSHLECLLDWRGDETTCPAACGCDCADYSTHEHEAEGDFVESFRSPPLIV